jgi:hypothetical protein
MRCGVNESASTMNLIAFGRRLSKVGHIDGESNLPADERAGDILAAGNSE